MGVEIARGLSGQSQLTAGVKTSYLYSMASKLINVRLDEEHMRKARVLREHGVAVSDLVREAIDARYEQVASERKPIDTEALMNALFEKYPDPPNQEARGYDVHDAKQARGAIVKRLRRET
jgi:antitoxin component of RelBE/YafQ-DinJ toxin-antitoxin module